MRRFLKVLTLISVVIVFIMSEQANMAAKNGSNKYPIICKSELGSAPKNVPLEKVDINSDGLIDLIATFPGGSSALYINCGKGQYYSVIHSAMPISTSSSKKNRWCNVSINFNWADSSDVYGWEKDKSTFIDGQLYRPDLLPFFPEEIEKINFEIIFDGSSYKLPCLFNKGLGIYAPRYRFDCSKTKDQLKKVNLINLELLNGTYKINVDNDSGVYLVSGIYYVELNGDDALDAVLIYSDAGGSGARTYGALLLNGGDNSFVFSGLINFELESLQQLKSKKITIGNKSFTALVYKQTPKEVVLEEEELQDSCAPQCYDLYLYQPTLKIFLYMEAKPGRDKSTFIPVDQKKYEYILNPPVLREK